MERFKARKTYLVFILLMSVFLITGCGGDGGGGTWDEPVPVDLVSFTVPTNNAVGVPIGNRLTVTFTEAMEPATINTTTFTVQKSGPPLGPMLGGAITYSGLVAVFDPFVNLEPNTQYTATITAGAKNLDGNPLARDFSWRFTTGATVDTTKPRVTLTVPATPIPPATTTGVFTNTKITATFTEDMNPLTFDGTTFKVKETISGIDVAGKVTYAVAARTATFTPTTPAILANSTQYTATIFTGDGMTEDLGGNQLAGNQAALPAASNYVWTFTTGAIADIIAPTVILTNPADVDPNVALNSTVNATFSEPMDPDVLSIGITTFKVQKSGPPLGPNLVGTVAYDPLTNIATFTPQIDLEPNTNYTATITTGAKDLAVPGNALVPGLVANPWTFTTGTGLAPGAVPLNSASGFGIMATSAITNTGAATMINGDVSLDPGTSNGLLPVQVSGTIHINDLVSAQARIDLLAAYNFAKALPPGAGPFALLAGADPGALFPLGVPPGIYTSGSTIIANTPMTLDAGGNANAVWVFQIGSSLTTGASVSLANGAQAKNVFWVPTSDATIGVGTIFYGTILAGRDVTGVTGAVINGRILAGAILPGTIALDTNTVNVPAP